MKKFMLQYLPETAIIMASCLFFTSLLNVFHSTDSSLDCILILQMFVYVLVTRVFLDLLTLLPFHSHKVFLFTYYMSIFVFFLLLSYIMKWFPFTPKWLLAECTIFTFLCSMLHLYFKYKDQKQADEINKLIKQ